MILIPILIPNKIVIASLDGFAVNGGHFTIYSEDEHTGDDMKMAKRVLRQEHDIASVCVIPMKPHQKEVYRTIQQDIKRFEQTHGVIL